MSGDQTGRDWQLDLAHSARLMWPQLVGGFLLSAGIGCDVMPSPPSTPPEHAPNTSTATRAAKPNAGPWSNRVVPVDPGAGPKISIVLMRGVWWRYHCRRPVDPRVRIRRCTFPLSALFERRCCWSELFRVLPQASSSGRMMSTFHHRTKRSVCGFGPAQTKAHDGDSGDGEAGLHQCLPKSECLVWRKCTWRTEPRGSILEQTVRSSTQGRTSVDRVRISEPSWAAEMPRCLPALRSRSGKRFRIGDRRRLLDTAPQRPRQRP